MTAYHQILLGVFAAFHGGRGAPHTAPFTWPMFFFPPNPQGANDRYWGM